MSRGDHKAAWIRNARVRRRRSCVWTSHGLDGSHNAAGGHGVSAVAAELNVSATNR